MELFTVTRYDTVEKQHDPEREKRILENLHKNIEKKKKKLKKRKVPTEEDLQSVIDPVDEEVPQEIENIQMENMDVDNEVAVDPIKPADETDFMVLGKDKFQRKQHIDMVLPAWLAYPTIISNDLKPSTSSNSSVENVAYLSPELKSVLLNSMKIEQLFPVQEAVIPWILNVHKKPYPFRPRDVCVSAPTGSGKTLAYALPIVELLRDRVQRKIRALIVLPVNELAVQVLKVFRKLCEGTTLSCTLLSKFHSFETEQAQLVEKFDGRFYSKVDIVVATTGRLVEHLHSTEGFSLKSLQFLVMDEADRIMEQIHNNWLYHLDSHVKEQSDAFLTGRAVPLCFAELSATENQQPHKLLFSATLSQDPEKLQSLRLFQPKLFTAIVRPFNTTGDSGETLGNAREVRGEFIGKFTTPAELTEKFCLTQPNLKPLTLYALIKDNNWNRFLCFTNSGESAHRLSYVLQNLMGNDMRIEELSSGLSPNVRNSVLQKFQMAKINGLICSDALARGIDIHGVDIVISYEAPRHVKTYIHRIGRTARAGKQGLAVTMLTQQDLNSFQNIIKEGGKSALEEMKVTSNIEELKAKEYASVVERLKTALAREKQIKILKVTNEKQKASAGKNNRHGFLGQLQSQLQMNGESVRFSEEPNVPESWKWENQMNITERKESKNKNKKNFVKKQKLKGIE